MNTIEMFLIAPVLAGVVGLLVALVLYFRVKSQPVGNETMNRIAGYIREGAMAFLVREYKVLALYGLVVGVVLGLVLGWIAALSFVLGAFLSLLAGFFGMKAATYANVRTTQAASTKSKSKALLIALDGGAVMGLSVAGLGLIGLGALYYVFYTTPLIGTILHSFAVGASSIALFARIGGGIYTRPPTSVPISRARSSRTFPKTIRATRASSPITSVTTSATWPAWVPTSTNPWSPPSWPPWPSGSPSIRKPSRVS